MLVTVYMHAHAQNIFSLQELSCREDRTWTHGECTEWGLDYVEVEVAQVLQIFSNTREKLISLIFACW